MANRRYQRRAGSSTRMLEWTSQADTAQVATAAATVRTVALFQDIVQGKNTIYRVVGGVSFLTQADVAGIFSFGIYKSHLIEGGSLSTLNPGGVADLSSDDWMWWTSRTVQGNAATRSVVEAYIPIDCKVKRILDEDTTIAFAAFCSVAYQTVLKVRVLSKATGTR